MERTLRRLTLTNGAFDAFPEWSPDGSLIAFTSNRAAADDVWVMEPDRVPTPCASRRGREVDERPDWSPDGGTDRLLQERGQHLAHGRRWRTTKRS